MATTRARVLLVSVTVAVTSVAGVLLSVLYPKTDENDLFSYAVVEPAREHFWTWHVIGPAVLVVGATTLALAVLVLVRARGAACATAGAAFSWLGAALYASGIGGLGPIHYFATDAEALEPAAGTRFLDYVNDGGFLRLWGPALAGAVLVALGTIALAVALWRAGAVPRWVPVVLAVAMVLTFLVSFNRPLALLVDCALAAASLAVAWYLWRAAPGHAGGGGRAARGPARPAADAPAARGGAQLGRAP